MEESGGYINKLCPLGTILRPNRTYKSNIIPYRLHTATMSRNEGITKGKMCVHGMKKEKAAEILRMNI